MVEYTREKILPEDLIQKTNLQQHNFMIDAINDIDGRQVDIEDVTNVNIDDTAILKTNVVTLSNEKLDKADIDADLHFGDISVTRDGTAVIMSLDVLNPTTGIVTPISFSIPGATSAEAGTMDASSVAWIASAEERISVLEGLSDVKAVADLTGAPTQAELTTGWVAVAGKQPEMGDILQDINNSKLWVFVGTEWVLYGTIVTVPLATTATIGGVRDTSLTAPGNRWYVHVEADGRLSLIGGDALTTLIDTTIPALQSGVSNAVKKTGNEDIAGIKTFKDGVYQKSTLDIGVIGYNSRIMNRLYDVNNVVIFDDQVTKENSGASGRKVLLANKDVNGDIIMFTRLEYVFSDKSYREYMLTPGSTWIPYRSLNADGTGYSNTPYRAYSLASNTDILTKGHVADILAPKQDTLTFDSAPVAGSNNPVKSSGIYNALATKANVSEVQSKLTFDDAPVSGSINPVKSGGVHSALSAKANIGGTINTGGIVNWRPAIANNTWIKCANPGVANFVTALLNHQNITIDISLDANGWSTVCRKEDTTNGDGYTTHSFLVPKNWYYRVIFKDSATCNIVEQQLMLE